MLPVVRRPLSVHSEVKVRLVLLATVVGAAAAAITWLGAS
ncbi:hypothetical protein SAMN04489730_8373 [Amycolatopsis australiensis]|uniref:Uncharacterized protein n=1 Tax=Amycolatopsis australiensis TaxID=546364 RepID=A0A1K1T630_9PSEU|nr:hypothetical protein SAMN04489730_8373 [Amycolatopsis australiensis]